jgi:hypothetical protein
MAQLLRLSIKGALPGGEEWSTNPCWTISDFGVPTTPAQIQAVATACAGVSPPAGLRAAFSTATNIHSIRVEARTSDGTLENLAEDALAAASPGTGTTPHPYQIAWVASLRTAQVGATGRGRLYFPATGIPLEAGSLRPSTVNTNSFSLGVKTYLSDLQTQIRATFAGAGLIVWSRTSQAMNLVDRIQAGDILDTQRRRRDTLVEAYSSQAYP